MGAEVLRITRNDETSRGAASPQQNKRVSFGVIYGNMKHHIEDFPTALKLSIHSQVELPPGGKLPAHFPGGEWLARGVPITQIGVAASLGDQMAAEIKERLKPSNFPAFVEEALRSAEPDLLLPEERYVIFSVNHGAVEAITNSALTGLFGPERTEKDKVIRQRWSEIGQDVAQCVDHILEGDRNKARCLRHGLRLVHAGITVADGRLLGMIRQALSTVRAERNRPAWEQLEDR